MNGQDGNRIDCIIGNEIITRYFHNDKLCSQQEFIIVQLEYLPFLS